MNELQQYLEIACKAAHAGAKIILENFGKSFNAGVKENSKGLVTKTDLEAEKAILKILTAQTNFDILAEESGANMQGDNRVWVVDPLDGTTNFANTIPLFAVSIVLMEIKERLLGAILDPVHQKEDCAIKGKGAFCNGKKINPISYSSEYIPMVFLNHGYSKTDRRKFQEVTRRLSLENNILKLGTTALELCYLAMGSADAFICSGDEIWDFAAGIVIAQEAGFLFTDWRGNPWDGDGSHLLFARKEIHSTIIAKINDLQ